MTVLEAKWASIDPVAAQDQGQHYAGQLGVPFVFLSNGEEVRFLDRETDAHARRIVGFYAQDDLERRLAARRVRATCRWSLSTGRSSAAATRSNASRRCPPKSRAGGANYW